MLRTTWSTITSFQLVEVVQIPPTTFNYSAEGVTGKNQIKSELNEL
jgi:hypothetical protein